MSISIPSQDRIINRTTPSSLTDKSARNALNLMLIYDGIVNGNYRVKLHSGTTAQRPVSPEPFEVRGNSDFNGEEMYLSSLGKWLIKYGVWTNTTKPDTADIAPGSKGFNTDLGQEEYWDGVSPNVWNIR